MTATLQEALKETLQTLWSHLAAFFPRLLAMFLILVAGLLAAWLIRWISRRLLLALRFDQISERTGLAGVLQQVGIGGGASALLSRALYWFVLLLFLVLSLSTLNLPATDQLISSLFVYLPNLVVAFVVLTAGVLLANFTEKVVLIAAVNAQYPSAHLLSRGTRYLILVFSVAVALDQLGIGRNIILAAFTIVFSAVALALALAFGLAGKDLARAYLEKRLGKPRQGEPEEGEGIRHL
jgi:small-conductance mechanosensitive channel